MIHFKIFFLFCSCLITAVLGGIIIGQKTRQIPAPVKALFFYFAAITLLMTVHQYVFNYVESYTRNSGALLQLGLFGLIILLPWCSHTMTDQNFRGLWTLLSTLFALIYFGLYLTAAFDWLNYLLLLPFLYFIGSGFILVPPKTANRALLWYGKAARVFLIFLPFVVLDLFKFGYLKTLNNPLVIQPVEFLPLVAPVFGVFLLKVNITLPVTGSGINPEVLESLHEQWQLSPREAEVLQLVMEGKENREIAEQLFISPSTAKKHVSNLLKKSGTASRWQLMNTGRDS